MVDNTIWLLIGVLAGQLIGYFFGRTTAKEAVHLAKMKMLADTGRDPLLVDAMKDADPPAPNKSDGIEELNKKIQHQFGDEYEVL